MLTPLTGILSPLTRPPPFAYTLVRDAFTASDGTTLHGRTPDVTVGGAAWDVTANSIVINSNQAVGGAANSIGTIETLAAEGVITLDVMQDGANTSILSRYASLTSHFLARSEPTQLAILEQTTGGHVYRATAPLTQVIPSTLRVTLSGTTITLTVVGSGVTIHYTTAVNAGVTRHGFRLNGVFARADNFLMTRF